MKNKILCILTLSLSSTVVAQHSVTYNFGSGDPFIVPEANFWETSVFKIENINKFIYEVKIESSQSEFFSKPPSVFTNFFQFEEPQVSKIKEEIDQTKPDIESDKRKTFETLGFQLSSVQMDQKLLSDLKEERFGFGTDTLFDLKERTDSLINEINSQQSEINNLRKKLKDEYLSHLTNLNVSAEFVHYAFNNLEESKIIKNNLVRLALSDGLNHAKAKDKINEINQNFPNIQNPERLRADFYQSYREYKIEQQLFEASQAVLSNFEGDTSKMKNSIKSLTEEIENVKKKVDEYKYAELFLSIRTLYSELLNENNYFIISDPVQAKHDIINYTVKITPKKDIESMIAFQSREFSTEVRIKGGIKIDFSTGLAISGLYDRTYSTDISSNDTTKSIIIQNNNYNFGNLSLAALMHISKRTTCFIKPGLTFGLGLNSTDLKDAQIFTGLSGILGTQERFIATIGATIANVDYLNSEFSLNKEVSTAIIEKNGITEKTNRIGFFVGLSYNLTNKKKE